MIEASDLDDIRGMAAEMVVNGISEETRFVGETVQQLLAEIDRSSSLRAELVRLRAAWGDDQGLRADRRFVEAVCVLLDQEPG